MQFVEDKHNRLCINYQDEKPSDEEIDLLLDFDGVMLVRKSQRQIVLMPYLAEEPLYLTNLNEEDIERISKNWVPNGGITLIRKLPKSELLKTKLIKLSYKCCWVDPLKYEARIKNFVSRY